MADLYSIVIYQNYQEKETGDGEPFKNLPQLGEAQYHPADPLTQPASKVLTSGHTTQRLLLISLCCLFFVLALTLGVLYALAMNTSHEESVHQLRGNQATITHLQKKQEELNKTLQENHATITQLQKQQENLNRNLQDKEKKIKELEAEKKKLPVLPKGDACCAKDWKYFSGMCYYFSKDKKTWTASRDACVDKGGHLVIVSSTEEQDFLKKSAPVTYEGFYWVGLTDAVKEGDWRWLDGTPLSAKSPMWSSGQPDNWKGEGNKRSEGENCAAMWPSDKSYGLFDKFCDAPKDSFYRVCEAITQIK